MGDVFAGGDVVSWLCSCQCCNPGTQPPHAVTQQKNHHESTCETGQLCDSKTHRLTYLVKAESVTWGPEACQPVILPDKQGCF